jgi:hypothetical protein
MIVPPPKRRSIYSKLLLATIILKHRRLQLLLDLRRIVITNLITMGLIGLYPGAGKWQMETDSLVRSII